MIARDGPVPKMEKREGMNDVATYMLQPQCQTELCRIAEVRMVW